MFVVFQPAQQPKKLGQVEMHTTAANNRAVRNGRSTRKQPTTRMATATSQRNAQIFSTASGLFKLSKSQALIHHRRQFMF